MITYVFPCALMHAPALVCVVTFVASPHHEIDVKVTGAGERAEAMKRQNGLMPSLFL